MIFCSHFCDGQPFAFYGVSRRIASLALPDLALFIIQKMTPLSKKKGTEVADGGGGKWTDGSCDIQRSGFIHSSEYFVTVPLLWGQDLKCRHVLWTTSVRSNGAERTLGFVEVSIQMRLRWVKNIPEDLYTDG